MHTREREPMALMILRAEGFWEFPKGKQEPGETDQETALRELKEETGLTGEIVEDLPIDTTYSFLRDGEQVDKVVRYFFCRVPDGSVAQVDKKEAHDHVWLPLENLADRATYPAMKEVAHKALLALAD